MIVIKVSALRKTYHHLLRQEVVALDGISFTIAQGETVAFLGPNGAGKTTTIKITLGLMRPDSGEVGLFDQSPENHRIRKKIGYLPENPSFPRFLTGKENLKSLVQMVDKEIDATAVEKTLRQLGLIDDGDRRVAEYSRGMIQRLGIGQAIIHNPELLILDEPLSSLDPIGRKEIRDLLLDLKDKGKTIFFSTHILPDVEPIADRVVVINKGQLVSDTRIEELKDLEDFLFGILK